MARRKGSQEVALTVAPLAAKAELEITRSAIAVASGDDNSHTSVDRSVSDRR